MILMEIEPCFAQRDCAEQLLADFIGLFDRLALGCAGQA